jgi:uncharacterized protein YkwD
MAHALEDGLLRKLGAALLALPVVIVVYLASLRRGGLGARIAAGVAASAVIGLVVVASVPPAPSAAVPVAPPPQPVAAALLDVVRTGHGLTAPFSVAFDAPMDPASVVAALRVRPEAPMSFRWDTAGRVLTIDPLGHWSPDTLYVITVEGTARGVDGGLLATPVRALVLTGSAGRGALSATHALGGRASLDTAFRIELDRPADLAAVRAALHTEPAIAGDVTAGATPGEFVFRPSGALATDTAYRVWLAGLADSEGIAFIGSPSVEVRTLPAPAVVRFRPKAGTSAVDRGAAISVRFTEQMDRASTAAAFTVTVAGKAVAGKVSWAETGTVLVFTPSKPLPYGASVVASVDLTASSKAGAPLAKVASGAFTVVPKPAPTPVVAKTTKVAKPTKSTGSPKPITHSGGGAAVSGSWTAVEAYYLKLMNCTRTGGWVTSSGSCSSPGGRSVAPLALSSAISAQVSRPYAKLLATRGICNHFIGGTPGDRLRRAGFTSYRWGENLGCRSGNPYSSVLGSHLFFQSEKPYNGGHYRNLMNAEYDRAGIGVWVAAGRVRLVVDLYHP